MRITLIVVALVVAEISAQTPPPKQCLLANEVYEVCGNRCGDLNTCANPDRSKTCKMPCGPGCFCKEGFIRSVSKGPCVRPSKCKINPPKKCTRQNEEFSECASPCNNCAVARGEAVCNFLVCNPGCDCKPGFYRNDFNACVSQEICFNCRASENKLFSVELNNGCQNTCDKPDNQPCNVPAGTPGCICKKGFLKDDFGNCVLPEECPVLPCGVNEEIVNCPRSCPSEDCRSIGEYEDCPEYLNCEKRACKCKADHRRNEFGFCVPISQCDCEDPNAVMTECANSCYGGVCDQIEYLGCRRRCFPWKCQCKKGFVKNDQGKCIPISKCSCKDPNAVMTKNPNPCSGGTCEQPKFSVCKAAGKPWGCQCKKGYVKDGNGECILASKCQRCEKPNEVFKKCNNLESFCDYSPTGTDGCNPGCGCKAGYWFRTREDRTCIPEEECPSICTAENESYSQCGSCQPTCEKPVIEACAAYCRLGCFCNEGYLRDGDKCVLPKDCSVSPQ